jgi:hypothetical protein
MGVSVKRGFLSTQIIEFFFARKFSKEIFCVLTLALSVFASSCNNIESLSKRNPSSEISFGDPSSGIGGGSFQLIGVYASQQSPGSMFDMVGADSQFDTYCTGTSGPCVCEYTYISPGIGTIVDEGSVSYQESNLLRCVNAVPSGISAFEVRILAQGTGDYSNTVTANLSSGVFVNTNYIDLSKEEAYNMVKRFQCRKREFIVNPLSKAMIDPIQSEDPKVIYPFNFYTTNVAASLWEMQQLTSQDWDCTLTPTHDRSLHWWANSRVFSASECLEAFCAGDSELMYPTNDLVSGKIPDTNVLANGKRRGSFFLAKQSYGVFQVPVKAAVGPNDYVSSKYGIIGYAARPIPNSGGSSSCPSITLPSNAEWVKLWNFRATDITAPKKVTDTISSLNSGIMCHPQRGVFPSCDNDVDGSATSSVISKFKSKSLFTMGTTPSTYSFSTLTTEDIGSELQTNTPADPTSIASRVVVLTSGDANACYNISAMGNGEEAWEPSPFAFAPSITWQNMYDLPWGIYQQISTADRMTPAVCADNFNYVNHSPVMSCAASGVHLLQRQPADAQLSTTALNATNYTDQLFVVTDPAVDDTQMRNQALSVSHYKPVTYRTSVDCSGPSRALCPVGKELHWDINIKDVGDPTGADQYPLCVLQFTD